MGAGKTEIGSKAAERLGVPFHDTDTIVESLSGSTVAEIWDQAGEERFRELETQAIASLGAANGIIAAGGGAPLQRFNRQQMSDAEAIVWLDCRADVLVQRLVPDLDTRPLLRKGETATVIADLARERHPIYENLASNRLDTSDMTIDEVADELVELWNVLS